MARISWLLLAFLIVAWPARADELAGQVEKILKTNCYGCHGQNGASEGGFGYVMSYDRLVATRKVTPNDPAKSKIHARMSNSEDPMPPDGVAPRPSAEDIATVKKWIEAGAPSFNKNTKGLEFIGPEAMIEIMAKDIAGAPPRDRVFLRYFTLTHLFNAGISADELASYRVGLSKLINSLSWGRTIVAPKPIDPAKTIMRIDLRDYRWSTKIWDEILFDNAFGVEYRTDAEKELRKATGTRLPYVRGDWFVHAASKPRLYHDILELPSTDRELEKLLKVEVAENIRNDRVVRAGFNGSGVSRNNRLIERHESPYGAYWKSYDFAGNAREKNIFSRPLGPGTGNVFEHNGGEIIFNLPNGLQAYLLVDAKGKRINKGPVDIVSDPKQPDRQVVNGLSCMTCHAKGMIEKDDQVRGHVQNNPSGFSEAERNKILAIYPVKDKFTTLIRADAERFRKAVEATGAPLSTTEPVAALARRFEDQLDVKLLAAEMGVTREIFLQRLDRSARFSRLVGNVKVTGGTVQRDIVADEAVLNVGLFGAGRAIGS